MAEELGKIEKLPVENFKEGRKLFFLPLVFGNTELPEEYLEKFNKYWEQAEKQITELTGKLGEINHIYHELISESGEAGIKSINELNKNSYKIVQICLGKKAQMEALEDANNLSEFMDWNRCLIIGLQNPGVVSKVYEAYVEAGKKRNKIIASKLDETLKKNEIGLLLMRENHQVQFPSDIQIFYIAPPALDEIKRWIREHEQKSDEDKDS
jgi:hypothetical protein